MKTVILLLLIIKTASAQTFPTIHNLKRATDYFLSSCWTKNESQISIPVLQNCVKQKTMWILDEVLKTDKVQIFDGIEFVRLNIQTKNTKGNVTDDFDKQIADKIDEIFETHILTIRLGNFLNESTEVSEGRHRNRRNNMMPFMVFGLIAMGMILIPMGFKFLAVLGGKALLLAKMALILSSIQGLKKVATSGFNYGFYHSPPTGHYDRHGYEDIPDEQLDLMRHGYTRS